MSQRDPLAALSYAMTCVLRATQEVHAVACQLGENALQSNLDTAMHELLIAVEECRQGLKGRRT